MSARAQIRHWLAHLAGVHKVRPARRRMPDGCTWEVTECVTCGEIYPVAHSAYCDPCGRPK